MNCSAGTPLISMSNSGASILFSVLNPASVSSISIARRCSFAFWSPNCYASALRFRRCFFQATEPIIGNHIAAEAALGAASSTADDADDDADDDACCSSHHDHDAVERRRARSDPSAGPQV